MLQTLSNRFYGWAKGWLVLVLLVLDIFFAGFLMPLIGGLMQDGTGQIQPLDLMMFQTPDKLFAMIERYGEYTRVFYRNVELTADILYPIIYLFAFCLLISWLFERGFAANSPMRKLNVIPVGAFISDLFENMTIVTLLTIYPSQPIALGWLLFVFTTLKWIFVLATISLMLAGLVMALKNGFKKQG